MGTARCMRHGLGILALIIMVPWIAAVAGDAETEDAPPTQGQMFGSGWNPTFQCVVEEGDTMDDILECLADGIASPPGNPCRSLDTEDRPETINGSEQPVDVMQIPPPDDEGCTSPQDRADFVVTRLPAPRHGIHIERLDGSEIDRLLLWENDPAIQMTSIMVLRDELLGRIGHFQERPSRTGGIVTVTVNGHPVQINTALYNKAEHLTDALIEQLRNAGFDVQSNLRYVIIAPGSRPEAGITSIKFESTDPDVVSSNLALLPLEDILFLLQNELLPDEGL